MTHKQKYKKIIELNKTTAIVKEKSMIILQEKKED